MPSIINTNIKHKFFIPYQVGVSLLLTKKRLFYEKIDIACIFKNIMVNKLPYSPVRHENVWQVFVSCALPGQRNPSHVLVLRCTPPPQDLSHPLQTLHAFQPVSRATYHEPMVRLLHPFNLKLRKILMKSGE